MTSYYKEIPTLDMRAVAAKLVVVGTVRGVRRTDTETYEGTTYVRTTFDVEVEEAIKGRAPEKHIAVQVLGGHAEQADTPLDLPVREGQRMLLMLSESDENGVYVPYLGTAFPLRDTRVDASQLAEKEGAPTDLSAAPEIDLDDVRRMVAEDQRVRAEEDAQPRAEPAPVLEMPTGREGAGQPGAPEEEPPQTEPRTGS